MDNHSLNFAEILGRKFSNRLQEFQYRIRLKNQPISKWYCKDQLLSISDRIEKYDAEMNAKKKLQQKAEEDDPTENTNDPTLEWQKFNIQLIKNQLMLIDIIINRDNRLDIEDMRSIKQELYQLSSKIRQNQLVSLASLQHQINMSEQNHLNTIEFEKQYPTKPKILPRNRLLDVIIRKDQENIMEQQKSQQGKEQIKVIQENEESQFYYNIKNKSENENRSDQIDFNGAFNLTLEEMNGNQF